LNGGKVDLKGLGSGVWVRVTSEDASIVSKDIVYRTGPRTLPWGDASIGKQAESSEEEDV
jgi:hypothetical protein